jgi:hypothetical protein
MPGMELIGKGRVGRSTNTLFVYPLECKPGPFEKGARALAPREAWLDACPGRFVPAAALWWWQAQVIVASHLKCAGPVLWNLSKMRGEVLLDKNSANGKAKLFLAVQNAHVYHNE